MYSLAFTNLFIGVLILTLLVRFWLGSRHIRHILVHRASVPPEFTGRIPLAAHQKAADYTVAKTKYSLLMLLVSSAILIGFTLLGGLQALSVFVFRHTGAGMTYQLALLAAFTVVSSVLDLPFDYYRQFVLEARFGFNKMPLRLFLTDMVKNAAIGAAIGLPLAWVVLRLMESAGDLWWLYAWLVFSGFQWPCWCCIRP